MTNSISEGERLIHVLTGIYAMLLGFLFIQGLVGGILGVAGLAALGGGVSGKYGLSMVAPGLVAPGAKSAGDRDKGHTN